jgi:hypothetical protein
MKKLFGLNRSFLVVALVLTALLISGVVFAATDVPLVNGNFTSNRSGWASGTAIPGCNDGGWDSVGNPTPGSALLTIAEGASCAALVQCVLISDSPIEPYSAISGTINIDGSSTNASAEIDMYAYSDTNCSTPTGNVDEAYSNMITTSTGTGWQSASTTQNGQASGHAVAVPASGSVWIVLYISGDEGDQAWFDNVTTYQSRNPTAVTLRDFSAQAQPPATWLWPITLVVVLSGAMIMLRRRRA